MKQIVTLRTMGLGLASWLVPFLVSFAFFDRSGQLAIPQPLFKSLMVVVFGGLGMALLVAAFRRVPASPRTGFVLGCFWLAINLLLDFAILLPFTKMPALDYVYDIGIRYLLIPIMATGLGVIAARSRSSVEGP